VPRTLNVRVVLWVLVLGVLLVPASQARNTRQAISLRPFLTGLDEPLYVTQPRSEPRRLYVVEKTGRIRVALDGRLVAQAFLDLRGRVSDGSEQGLLSVAFHPQYARNHRFYVDYTDRNGDTRVVEYRAKKGRALPKTARQLLFVRQPYANHNGGQLQFGPDGLLYVGMGDGGSGGDPENRAQNVGVRLGKLLKINPLNRRARWQIAGYGLRNPWRFSFDKATGDLYVGDVGQGSWEEIDFTPRVSPGLENYGWRVYEGNHRYAQDQQPSGPGKLVFPVAEYPHSQGCSVTGGYVYRGRAVPAMTGRYVYGDYCSGRIWSLAVAGGRATGLRQEGVRVAELSSWGEDAAGEVYATSLRGTVFKLGA
jgi:glucose/arabinose dehydrogenase